MLTAIVIIFLTGYLAIALEHQIRINKAASALFIGALCWALYAIDFRNLVPEVPHWFAEHVAGDGVEAAELPRHYLVEGQLLHLVGEIAYILFFLMGAMTIVELVDAHEGFSLITSRIRARSKLQLLWVVSWMTFFLSAVLDNLTTTIVMVSLLKKLVADRQTRLFFVGMVVVAANAGGAWTVIGDVTTTMLWIKHKIGTFAVMYELILPSITCLLVPLLFLRGQMQGDLEPVQQANGNGEENGHGIAQWHKWVFLLLGLAGLLSVPVFKATTHLPPFMGMMLSLSVLWIVSELISHTMDEQVRTTTGVLAVLKRVDMSSILFFLGILLAVGSLGATGLLHQLASWLDRTVPWHAIVAIIIGLVSAVVDNVPLVAAGIEMYQMPMNDFFWMMLAYCAGTGGSCLIIGSAAGVAAMGLEHIEFLWYARRIAPFALLGYFAGAAVYMGLKVVLGF